MFLQLILAPLLLLTFNFETVTTADMDHAHMNHHNHEDMTGSMESMHSMPGMDMNGTGMDMDMMKSYFHTTLGDTLLFKSWVLDSSSRTFVACIVFFLMALLYEGLKSYREFLFTRVASKRCYSVSVINTGSNGCPENCVGDGKQPVKNAVTCKMWSWAHFYQSVLHVIQVIASYTLMLGFMSFNIWICLAIALGAGHGYFLFCWKRITVVDVTEHCN